MGRRGPPPKPTVLKIARGNPGKRALNTEEPDLPVVADPLAVPPGLTKRAKDEWLRLAPELVASGVLTIGDLSSFEQYVRAVADVDRYQKLVSKVGLENAHKLGYAGYLLKLRAQLRQMAGDLGLTPSSRSNVKRVRTADATDEKRKRFFGTKGVG